MHNLTYDQASNAGLAVLGRAVVGVIKPIPSWTDIVDGPVIPDHSLATSGPLAWHNYQVADIGFAVIGRAAVGVTTGPLSWHDIVLGPLVPGATTN